ncbi:hypothetical protein SMSKK35_1664 [Stenotrophomonas maltophilia SKK35]|uniref:hypothetical protein n=1 Tax=Stenotrophomonas TaxID=40323 RepID=UPI0002C53238|nr:hypothetical protein [Stenotrophomonas sp. Sm6012]MBH1362722.1 hypothetical protein [Stenotrophomonas maltophilia]MDQ7279396.1 hypothetical protein [Stenotrophomonas sp. Sm6012]CCP11705.1 hypothetical protein SMSKK35_1664 [Stenotrophomonas maltophilia SKK35]HEL3178324.1 hypothetical protein [Stenotrophomonas maltophilia]
MAWCSWAATALCVGFVIAAQARWFEPPVPSPIAFQRVSNERFSQLRRQATQFVKVRPGHGFQFVERHEDASFQVNCKGVPVLWLEKRPQHVLLQVSLDAKQRAPAVALLLALLQGQLQPVDYLEQVLAGVPEPVLMDRVLQMLAGEVPDGVRCGMP